MKSQPKEWEKILANQLSNKQLKYVRNSHNSIAKTKTKQNKNLDFKMGKGSEWIFFQRWHTDNQQAHEKMLCLTNHQRKCKSKPLGAVTSHLMEWLSSKRQEIMSVGEAVEKKKPLCHCWWEMGAATKETGWMILKQLKIQLPDDPAIPFLDIYPKESNTSKKYLHPHALCSIIHNSQGMEAT